MLAEDKSGMIFGPTSDPCSEWAMLRCHDMRKFMLFCVCCLLCAAPAFAQDKSPAPLAMAEHNRPVIRGRAVFVQLLQSEIDVEVDVGRVASDDVFYGNRGAYVGGYVIYFHHNDDKRESLTAIETDKARYQVAPLRRAIMDFDFDTPAMEASRTALSRLEWLGAQEPTLVKSQADDVRDTLARAGTQQAVTITYRYSLSPDFTQVRVIANVAIWQPDAKGTQGRFTVLCQQRVAAIVELRRRSYDSTENVAQWSADKGRLARESIRAGLARLEQLIPFALGMTQADIDALGTSKTDKAFAAGFYGPTVKGFPSIAGEKLIWSRGLVNVMPAPEASAGTP